MNFNYKPLDIMGSNDKFFIDMEPKSCHVCDRICFLRCFECDTNYCSAKCLIKDWDVHYDKRNHKEAEEAVSSKYSAPAAKGINLGQSEEVDSKQKTKTVGLLDKEKRPNVAGDDRVRHKPNNFFYGDPNSLTFKLVEPNLPEHVKNGVKVSVQGRLSKAKSLNQEEPLDLSTAASHVRNVSIEKAQCMVKAKSLDYKEALNEISGDRERNGPFMSKIIYKDEKSQLYKPFF